MHERAALLGVDYERLLGAGRQLRRGTHLVSGVFAVVSGIVCGLILAIDVYPVFSVGSLLGVAVSFVAAFLVLIAVSLILQTAPVRRLDAYRQQAIASASLAAVWAAAYFATVQLCPGDWRAGLALGFVISTCLFSLAGAQSLPAAIAANHPKLLVAVRQQQSVPPHFTLLGYDARWLIACLAWGFVESSGVALLIAFVPLSVIPIVVVRAVVTALESRTAWSDPRGALVLMAVESSVFLIGGVVVALSVASLQ